MERQELTDMLIILITVMISQVYMCLFKFVQLITCKQYSNKPIVKKLYRRYPTYFWKEQSGWKLK
jgi:hypothetical protein